MATQKEFILHPRPMEITGLKNEEVIPFLIRLWDSQVTEPVPDFDSLFGAGQLARQIRTAGVESEMRRWLAGHTNPSRLDVGGCFLMGLWRGASAVDDPLVQLLAKGLSSASPGGAATDSLIGALGTAFDVVRSRETKEAIEREFGRMWAAHGVTHFQKSVEETLKYVLRVG